MSWSTVEAPIPQIASAILLLPSGHRAYDEDFAVAFPVPQVIDVTGEDRGTYQLFHLHHAGAVDGATRALYVLGGRFLPQGAGVERLSADEVFDQ